MYETIQTSITQHTPHDIIQINSDQHLTLLRKNHSYLFTSLSMKIEYNEVTQVYRSTQDFLEFPSGYIVINQDFEENTPTFWVNSNLFRFDSTTPNTNLVLIGTMIHATSGQVSALKIRAGKTAITSQSSVQALWELEKTYLVQGDSKNFSSNHYANRYQIPSASPVPNVASISPDPYSFQDLGMSSLHYYEYLQQGGTFYEI